MTTITQDALNGFRRIAMDNGTIRVQFLPELAKLGGKMTSLVRTASGHEFILQPQRWVSLATLGPGYVADDVGHTFTLKRRASAQHCFV